MNNAVSPLAKPIDQHLKQICATIGLGEPQLGTAAEYQARQGYQGSDLPYSTYALYVHTGRCGLCILQL